MIRLKMIVLIATCLAMTSSCVVGGGTAVDGGIGSTATDAELGAAVEVTSGVVKNLFR